MKQRIASMFALCLIAAMCSTQAHAKCRAYSFTSVPKQASKNIPTNVKIFFALFGRGREKATTILKNSSLKAKGHSVALKVSVLPSSSKSYNNDYLLIEPQKSLHPNTTYKLKLAASSKKFSSSFKTKWMVKKFSGYHFSTGKVPDKQKPKRLPKPTSTGYKFERFGCGPSEIIPLKLMGLADNLTPQGQLRFKLDIIQAAPGKTEKFTLYIDPPWRAGLVELGHGMCDGNYTLVKGAQYTIKVSAIDYAGLTSLPSPPITVKAQ